MCEEYYLGWVVVDCDQRFINQERYWKGVFEESSVRDQGRAQPVCEANWNLVQPVTSAELSDNLKMLNDSAPGPDGMRLKDLRGIPSEQLLARFNLWLWTGYQRKRCRVGETVCIPKVRGSMEASNHRPKTMSIMIIRLFTTRYQLQLKDWEFHLPF
jgi:hypothetical protein